MKRYKCIDFDRYLNLEDGKTYQLHQIRFTDCYVIESEQSRAYFCYGNRHCEDGPAIITYDENGKINDTFFWLNGSPYNKNIWFTKISKVNRIKYLFSVGIFE